MVGNGRTSRAEGSGGAAFDGLGSSTEDVGPDVVAASFAIAFFVELSHKGTVELGLRAQRLAQIADGRSATLCVSGLVVRNESREIGSEGFHDARLPFGNSLSIPFGTLPMGNRNLAHE